MCSTPSMPVINRAPLPPRSPDTAQNAAREDELRRRRARSMLRQRVMTSPLGLPTNDTGGKPSLMGAS